MKAACVIGIDHYQNVQPLQGCVADARAVGEMLEVHGDAPDGSEPPPNFEVKLYCSDQHELRAEIIRRHLQSLFASNATSVLFFFSGHGLVDRANGSGWIVSQDGQPGALGIGFNEILGYAHNANPTIQSTTIILDCCNSGDIGAIPAGLPPERGDLALLRTGMTILTASRSVENALESSGQGVFSRLLLTGLNGAAADVMGRVTPASLYAHIDQSLGAFEQRPIFKANVQDFVQVRRVKPMVAHAILRALPKYFDDVDAIYPLGPQCDPDRDTYTETFKDVAVDPAKEAIYRNLQSCNRAGLVVPVNADHIWEAAMKETGCRLSDLGKHYWHLASKKRIRLID